MKSFTFIVTFKVYPIWNPDTITVEQEAVSEMHAYQLIAKRYPDHIKIERKVEDK